MNLITSRMRTIMLFFLALLVSVSQGFGQMPKNLQQTILFGAAYYEEYSPTDRLDEDVRMMKATGITVIRIAESTWGTLEPQEGVFDFSHVDRVLLAMDKAGIKVIVGTPTYAIPTWLAREHPDVLVVTPQGRSEYGRRQNMDITNRNFRSEAERVIVALVEHVKDHQCVIGYQLDNETKAYDTSGPSVQATFVKWMRERHPDLAALNKEFGLDYWSNRINRWEDFPSVNGAINASLSSAFAEFQRGLVTEYLGWQAALVRKHARADQFLTQNFDLDWRGYSYGIQPDVNHFEASRPLDVVGIDIYHPTQDHLTGAEIALGGDLARSMRGGQNYLVMETEAQGFPEWTPYPGQLRLQAFSHLASGAAMVEYWHWGTTSNAAETYWRGLLSQDFKPNPTYEEAGSIGKDLARLGPELVNMRKQNRIAIYVSNRALTAFNAFKFGWSSRTAYNDVLRPFYDALYRINAEVDFVDPSTTDLSHYKLIIVPALYAAADAEIERLNAFAKAGGHVVYTFKSGFSDENVKVRSTTQPGLIAEAAGVRYNQFTIPEDVSLEGDPFGVGKADNTVRWWMELLTPTTAETLAKYHHPVWGKYTAVTRNAYGKGEVTYVGFMPSEALAEKIVEEAVKRAGLWAPQQVYHFPMIVRSGVLANGHAVHYLLNYSADPVRVSYGFRTGKNLLSGESAAQNGSVALSAWGVAVIEEGVP
ncbi:MAG TPA: beta-galactosidase [Candidatus Sulfotelmatobacter sp.]|nr:beta-galactosidase [Candidatus Sulfotelmatobacter sp.]